MLGPEPAVALASRYALLSAENEGQSLRLG